MVNLITSRRRNFFKTKFYHCGIRTIARIVRGQLPWRKIAVSECF